MYVEMCLQNMWTTPDHITKFLAKNGVTLEFLVRKNVCKTNKYCNLYNIAEFGFVLKQNSMHDFTEVGPT